MTKMFCNGGLIPVATARIDPADRGFTLGDGVFETIRAVAGRPLRLAGHLARLRAGAATLGIPVPLTDAELAAALGATLDVNDLADGVLRLTLTRGVGPRGLLPPAEPRPTLLIVASPPPIDAAPAVAILATATRRNEHSPLSRIKSLNYLDNILARREAEAAGAPDAILLNTAGRLSESTVANLFLVIDGRLVTPPLADGPLPGIIRNDVIRTFNAAEMSLLPADIARASEAFLTNSLGVRPLLAVNNHPVGDGTVGPVATQVRAVVAAAG